MADVIGDLPFLAALARVPACMGSSDGSKMGKALICRQRLRAKRGGFIRSLLWFFPLLAHTIPKDCIVFSDVQEITSLTKLTK